MKGRWNRLAKRIDKLAERERLFIFLMLFFAVLAITDALWLTPAQKAQTQLIQQFNAQTTELAQLRVELANSRLTANPALALHDELDKVQTHLQSLNQEISQLVPDAAGGPALERVLVEFLRKQDGLTLLGTGTMKDETPPVVSAAAAAAGLPASAGPILTRRGLELRVAGAYPALLRYVKTLETALPQLRWGPMQLKADKNPPELTLTVYVLGVHP